MHNIDRPQFIVRMMRQNFPHVGATIPAAFTAALDKLTETYDITGQVVDPADPTWRRDLSAAVIAAVASGSDIADDKTVRELLVRKQLSEAGVPGMVRDHVELLRRQVIVEHSDDLLDELHRAFVVAAETIEEARTKIPALDLSSREGLSSVTATHMTLWGRAYDAAERIRTLVPLWAMIAMLTHPNIGVQNDMRPLVIADLTADQLDRIPTPRDLDSAVLGAVLHGFPLSLATPDEFRERCERVREEWQERDKAHSHA
ncbi:hypothetical protein [Rhodococcus tibetensis]|uniref:Uncharacterized protein n=1 Tax=Rhodococcus tibetensis TaxID=2965064 RepID=A0ABT1QDS7_9NOCA|nr:hypothetical protein [Rhodococcus sp. FXJ9.536]MCQ4120439.1 hypothetical protein [Rhodococcus sp. FXJ9.536]